MFLAHVLNAKGIFQRLGGWRVGVEPPIQADINHLLFRVNSAYLALSVMEELERSCVSTFERYRPEMEIKREKLVFWSQDLVSLLNQFSPFLSSLGIAQNCLLPIVQATTHGGSVPSSLNGCIKSMHKLKLAPDIKEQVFKYWNGHGKYVKGYRDIDHHFYPLIEHVTINPSPKASLSILLPDDIEQKSKARATFAEERDALSFFRNSFFAFESLVDGIAKQMGFPPSALGNTIGMEHIGVLEEGVRTALALMANTLGAPNAVEVGQTEGRTIYIRQLPEPANL